MKKRRAPQRFGVWLLLLPAVACSLTLNINKLSDGCPAGQVDCEGECKVSCATASGGTGGSSGSGGGDGGGGGKVNGSGGTTGATSGNAGAGGEGGTEACAIAYPFAYEPTVAVTTVHLAGSFYEDWNLPGIEMTEDENGVWRVVVDDMPEGKSVYKFLLDVDLPSQAWKQDPNNALSEPDGFTARNSILMLECGEDYLSMGGAGGAGGIGAGGAASGGSPVAGGAAGGGATGG